jgi:hypothetical protein
MTSRIAAVLSLVIAAYPGSTARADDACKPVLLCPYAAAGGGAGTGGAGTGGSSGGGGTAGHPGGALTLGELTLSRRVVRLGTSLEGAVTATNGSNAPLTLRALSIAVRPPGGSHQDGPYFDLLPSLTMVTIPAGGHVTLSASRSFQGNDPVGRWESYATFQDAAGWHDQPSEYFVVVAAAGGGGGGSGGGGTPGVMSVGAQAWFVAPWAGTPYFKPGVDWARAYADGDDIWDPQFLAELRGFTVWRHMDLNAVNWSDIHSWSQRKLPTDPRNQEVYIDRDSPPDTTGLAVEWQIDLCNRAHVDCWFTHPYLADDEYIRQQAMLIKAKLDPGHTIYIELSNEVWNGNFAAFDQSIQAGVAMGVPGDNEYYQGIAHEMVRALQMYQIYSDVFGAEAMGKRVVRVFSESGNLDLTTQALRSVYESGQWNPHSQLIDMMALAPYIGNGVDGAAEDLERWSSEVDEKMLDPVEHVHEAHVGAYGIPLLGCYEAGMHHLSNANVWAANSQAYSGYVYMLDRFAELMNGPCVLYTLHGTWEGKGAWGLYDHVGQALSAAPKARAAHEWVAGTATRAADTQRTILIIVLVFLLVLLVGVLMWMNQQKRKG